MIVCGFFCHLYDTCRIKLSYITANFSRQDCMVLFLTSPAATMSLYQNVNKFLSYRTLQVAIKLYCQYVHKPSLTNQPTFVSKPVDKKYRKYLPKCRRRTVCLHYILLSFWLVFNSFLKMTNFSAYKLARRTGNLEI